MSTFSRTATLFSTVALGSMLTASTVSSVDTVIHAAETTQTAAQKQSYKLQILQGDKDATSTASQFYLNTISLEKLANGNYYAYLTSNTPVNLGDEPISSKDTQHQVTKMGTTQTNGYNQTVYRMSLSASELASGQPIKTNIHVNIPMMNYDHDYTIRLAVQGFKPETAASSQSTSSVSSASTTNSSSSVAPSSSVVTSSKTESSVENSASQSTENSTVSSTDTSKSTVAKTESSQDNSQQAASDTAASTVDNSKTAKSAVTTREALAGTEVKMSADQGMDRFLKPSAHIDIKGESTDVTLSFNSDKVISMIPYMIFDGQKKEVTSQNITFTIPTKDLTPDKDGNVKIVSTTHVDAMGHVMNYPSNLTFNVSQLMPAQKTFKTGDYQIAVSPDSKMDRFFAPKFNVKVGDVTSVVTVAYRDPSMAAMIPNVTFDGQKKDLNGKTAVDFTIPTKDLMPDKDGNVKIASSTHVDAMGHVMDYPSGITFNMNPALVNPVNDKPDQSSSSSSETSAKPNKDILQDGTYSINYNVYKSGTTDDSTMANYMTQSAKITVKKGEATIDFATKNEAMSMMKEFSINGAKAQAKGDSWIVKLPVKDLAKTATAQMTIEVPQINFTEKPSADIVFDMKSIKNLDNSGSSSSSSSATSSSKPTTPAKPDIENDGKYAIDYKVYKSDTTEDSAMANYMTSSAKVTVKKGQATIDFATKNDAMSMMKKFSVNDVKAKAKGDSWIVTLPAKDLKKTLTAQMTIFVAAINFTETPSADISFDMKSLKALDNDGASSSSSAASSSKPSQSSSSAASSSKPSQTSSSAASSSKPSQSSSSAASSSKPSQSSSSAASSSKPSQSSSSAASSSKPSQSSSSAASSSETPANYDIENDGKYAIDYKVYKSGTTENSAMANYMTSSATVTVKKGQATIDFATKNAAMSMMQKFSVNGVKAEAKGDSWIVTLPAKDLKKTLTAQMTIFVAAINFTETPSADISFDMKSLKPLDNDGGASSSSSAASSSKPSSSSSSATSSSKPNQSSSSAASSSKPSQSSSSATSSSKPSQSSSSATSSSKPSSSSSSAASSNKPSQSSSSAVSSSKPENKPEQKLTTDFKDGTYNVNYHIYKSGTNNNSTMSQYMTTSAQVVIKNGKATINFATKNNAMSMMKTFSVNGVKAKAKGDNWTVKVPAKDLTKTLTAHMHIEVPQIGLTEDPDADIKFDIAKGEGSQSSSSATSSSKPNQSSSSASSSSKPSQSSSSATSSSKPSQSSSSATSSSKPSQSSSSAVSSSKPENKPEQKLTTDFKDGTYNVNYHIYKSGTNNNSTMSQYMTTSAKVAIKNGKATINFATKNNAMSMMKTFSVNGVKAQAKGTNWTVTVPAKNLAKTLTAHMHIEVPQIGLTEDPDADIKFDIAKGEGSQNSSSADSSSKPSQSSSSATSSSDTGTKPIKDNKKLSLKNNGIYSINYRVYKTGTHTKSTMQQYMTASANILVKDGKATVKFATKNGAMSLMKALSINGVTAHKNGNAWQVTVPVSSLRQTLKAHMTIFVPAINFTEHPDADIVFDLSSLRKGNDNFSGGQNNGNSGSGTANGLALPTGHQNAIRNAVLHQLTILHGNNNSTSVAAQYFLPTIQLVHNANGSYTGYITTHTPVMMGRNPISFIDGAHQVHLVSTIKTGNYYQSTYRLALSESEIKAPIATRIHVQFTAPLNYNHTYTIRLVIGRILNNASEATQPQTGLPDASGLKTSPLDSDVSRGTFATDFNADTITGASFTPLDSANTNDQKQDNAKNDDKDKSRAKKNSDTTQVAKDAQADAKSNNTTQRNVLIVAGGILATALGYVGVALLTNFFKMR